MFLGNRGPPSPTEAFCGCQAGSEPHTGSTGVLRETLTHPPIFDHDGLLISEIFLGALPLPAPPNLPPK